MRQDIADFASCVRSQSAVLSTEENESLSAEVGYLGANVSGASELRRKLNKKYSASDEVMMQVVSRCDNLVGNTGNMIASDSRKKVKNVGTCDSTLDMPLDCNL